MNEQLIMMEKYGLTPSEYFVVELIFMVQEGYEESYLLRYLKLNKSTFRDDLVSLQNKGIILKSWNIPEKGLPLQPVRGLLPAYGLQSTPDRNKINIVNSLQE